MFTVTMDNCHFCDCVAQWCIFSHARGIAPGMVATAARKCVRSSLWVKIMEKIANFCKYWKDFQDILHFLLQLSVHSWSPETEIYSPWYLNDNILRLKPNELCV